MRAVVLAFAGLVALAAISARAAPITMPANPLHIEADMAPPIELVREGCGWGWHRAHTGATAGVIGIGPLRSELVMSLASQRSPRFRVATERLPTCQIKGDEARLCHAAQFDR